PAIEEFPESKRLSSSEPFVNNRSMNRFRAGILLGRGRLDQRVTFLVGFLCGAKADVSAMPTAVSMRLLSLLVILLVLPQAASGQEEKIARAKGAFTPGEIWLDTKGKPINAHGGGMLYQNKTYYWYGENKVGRSWIPEANQKWDGYRVEVTGIRCYS